MRILIFLILLSGCMPANKTALERTNINVNEVAKMQKVHTKILVETNDLPKELEVQLLEGSERIVEATEAETKADVGIFNWDSIKNGLSVGIKIIGEVVTKAVKENPYGSLIVAGITLITGLASKGAFDGIKERKNLRKKAIVAERHNPADIEKHKAIEKQVDEDIKTGKVKI